MKKNHSLFGMPENVIFCKECIISNQRPNSTIEFKSKNIDKQRKSLFKKNFGVILKTF